jgi:hypothetical protein
MEIFQPAQPLAIFKWISKFRAKCSKQKSFSFMRLKIFQTMDNAKSNKKTAVHET